MRKVLLVAYIDNALNYTSEIENVSALHCTTVVADISINADRVQAIAEGGNYDVVHFLAHGDNGGILSQFDGPRIPESTILRICKGSGAKLIFFNSCSSVSFAQRLVNDGVPAVICYAGDLDDGVALSHCRSFYNELATLGDLRAAYDNAKDSEGKLIWLSNGSWAKIEQRELIWGIEKTVSDVKRYIAVTASAAVVSGVWLHWLLG